MDAERREIENGAIVIHDNVIELVGVAAMRFIVTLSCEKLCIPDRTLDASGCILLPRAW